MALAIAFEFKLPQDTRGLKWRTIVRGQSWRITVIQNHPFPLYRLLAVLSLLLVSQGSAGNGQVEAGGTPVFELVRENASVDGERRQVMRFSVDGLRQYVLVLWPAGERPQAGWPVLLFNHGYHPDPPEYGRNGAGENDRPGDYYRGLAQAYVHRGFVVVAPDYRGHNESEGVAFAERADGPIYYGRDAVAAFRALASLQGLDDSRRFMAGHSMGGLVTLAALAVVGEQVAAASIWSTMAPPDSTAWSARIDTPLLIQHARDDEVTRATGSATIAAQLRERGTEVRLVLRDGADHLFKGAQFDAAVALDLDWFARERIRPSPIP